MEERAGRRGGREDPFLDWFEGCKNIVGPPGGGEYIFFWLSIFKKGAME